MTRLSLRAFQLRQARLLIIQFGDYAEAVHRFGRGGDETYYAQRYTVEYVAGLAHAGHHIRVITIGQDAPLERLPSGVESMGLRVYRGRFRRRRIGELIRVAKGWRPTHLLLQVPLPEVLRWAVRRRIQTLPLLYDSFRAVGLRCTLRHRRLASALNHPAIPWAGNHGRDAAEDLARIGVNPDKVLPFDWPALLSPNALPPKKAPSDPGNISLTYVGQIASSKGVGEVIAAVAAARKKGEHYRAMLVGAGENGEFRLFQSQVRRLGVGDRVDFGGRVPHSRALEIMNNGDVVVVPSRPQCPEGVPMTIFEGLASRTPVVVSDHPMFRSRIAHRHNAMVFRASDPQSLFETIRELVHDAPLYERLSRDAVDICDNFLGPLKWDQVISRWLGGSPGDDAWLGRFALAHSAPELNSERAPDSFEAKAAP
jgi:glycosyltransferase involved in cell wall biosynthesis